MDVLYPVCAGLDVHKKLVVVCVCSSDAVGHLRKEVRTFSTMTVDILELAAWLTACGVTHVAMESTDEHRALNYLAMRYPTIYAKAAEEFGRDFSLTGVEVRPSPLSGTRKIVDVIFSYTNRNTDFTEKFFVRCDVTEEFPFLVTKLSPYYDR